MTLPGAMNGVLYFIVPEWDKLFEAKLWYLIDFLCASRNLSIQYNLGTQQ
jgi:hypothetical protein